MIGVEEKRANKFLKIENLHPVFRENITTLRDRLMLAYGTESESPRLIALTGCQGGEGVSTVGFYLALSMAQQCRVLLVDSDPESPVVIQMIRDRFIQGFPAPPKGPEGVVAHVRENFDVLNSCRLEGEELAQFDSPLRLAELLGQYRECYDYVLIDTPPVTMGSAALRIGSAADGVILVVEAERTLLEAAKRACEQLRQVQARILGVVLNKRTLPIPKPFYRT